MGRKCFAIHFWTVCDNTVKKESIKQSGGEACSGYTSACSSPSSSSFHFSLSGSRQQIIICLHHVLSLVSSSVTPAVFMSSFTTSMNLLRRSSSSPPARRLHLQHPSSNIITVPPLHVTKPSQPCLSYFISTLFNL
ncbi:hypothetical protein JOB18_003432 [Solea senegalensis]|uniref:Uncharacterized protein n=1 Tax=Solea senegalensis TaxID=28829 RepID=A0AAV6R983_SOLSE|nr:hypothetical protein JOB18_003432 [Solea senegalensis]